MNTLVSQKFKEQAGGAIQKNTAGYIDSAFNYLHNGESFQITFLEFGATGCRSCKMMETVMEEVKRKYPNEIKVKFVNVLIPANQVLMKYYGIAAIPTQVILNNAGQDVFRHTGYFTADDLEKEFKKINQ